MAFNWKELLGAVAPTLGASLGGPVGALAGKLIAQVATGDENADEKQVEQALKHASPELLAGLKKADQDFKKRMAELDIDLERINAGDRDSARAMQKENKSRIVPVLATLTVTGFFVVVFWILNGKISADSTLAGFVLGQVSAKAEQVYNFFFGSSAGSKQKTDALAKLNNAKT
ncbi:MAG: hypothetical protein OEZ10_08650 [Gammaproteobacteria bacterium]|nr:hypothetical protein [Gammaproteobacteria bacterium]